MNHIAFLGGGNMATAIITGMIKKGGFLPAQISVVEHNEAQRALLNNDLGIQCYENVAFAHAQMTTKPDIWVLAVKPQNMHEVLSQLVQHIAPEQIALSIAAGLPVTTLQNWLNGHAKIVRTMPNTPALVGQGMTGVFAPNINPNEHALIEKILTSVGQMVWVNEESQIDAVTAISGSGPAYVFYMMEQLTQSAMDLGFDAATAKQLVQATFAGAVQLAGESTETIATLRERVTSKGGTTAAALSSFAEHGLDTAIHAGVAACKARAEELAQELSAG
jgi:pyrroline-5-carboxylate reductase